VEKAIKKADIATKWEATAWAKKLTAKAKRVSLNDFERFQVKVNKQKRARIIRTEVRKLKKA
jgi:large subunit ribosomal protein L14e